MNETNDFTPQGLNETLRYIFVGGNPCRDMRDTLIQNLSNNRNNGNN